ncbi:cation transporter [bacterium]|nr:cation transporter [bacterium]
MNTKSVFLTLAALAILAGSPDRLEAEFARIEISVDGMSCPFCAYGVEKRLTRMESVRAVDVDLESGLVTVYPASGFNPSPDALNKAIKDAGFSPRGLMGVAVGTLVIEDGVVYLAQRGTGALLVLETQELDGSVLGEEVPAYLSAYAAAGTLLAAGGGLHAHKGKNPPDPPGIEVASLEEIQSVSLSVDGLACEGCSERAAEALAGVAGVYRVENGGDHLVVESIGLTIDPAVLVAALKIAGFSAVSLPA